MISAKAGFSEVTPAASGEQALELLASSDVIFDCLLFDISMPGTDGIELCRCVRQTAVPRRPVATWFWFNVIPMCPSRWRARSESATVRSATPLEPQTRLSNLLRAGAEPADKTAQTVEAGCAGRIGGA